MKFSWESNETQHQVSGIKKRYSKYIMGQVRIKKVAYKCDVLSQLLIFKNEIGTNY